MVFDLIFGEPSSAQIYEWSRDTRGSDGGNKNNKTTDKKKSKSRFFLIWGWRWKMITW